MKSNETSTFCLVPESHAEYEQWKALLAPYCWAEGEFGMLLTEAAFRQICRDGTDELSISREIRGQLTSLAARVEAGDYADVCLQQAADLAGDAP
jgi:uncharacterized membrane protein